MEKIEIFLEMQEHNGMIFTKITISDSTIHLVWIYHLNKKNFVLASTRFNLKATCTYVNCIYQNMCKKISCQQLIAQTVQKKKKSETEIRLRGKRHICFLAIRTLWRVRVTIVAVETQQYVLCFFNIIS